MSRELLLKWAVENFDILKTNSNIVRASSGIWKNKATGYIKEAVIFFALLLGFLCINDMKLSFIEYFLIFLIIQDIVSSIGCFIRSYAKCLVGFQDMEALPTKVLNQVYTETQIDKEGA